MAITFVTSGGATNINAGSCTIDYDETQLAVNDLLLIAWSCGDDDFTQPTLAMTTAGYTELTTSTLSVDGGAGGDGNLAIFYKYYNGTDTNVVTAASGTGTDSSNAVGLLVFRGVATAAQGGPLEIAIQTATGASGGDPDAPQVSGFDEATAAVVICGATTDIGATPSLAAATNYESGTATAESTETNRAAVRMGYRIGTASDPENPGAMTSTGDGWCAATLVLKAAPTAVPTIPSLVMARTRV